MTPLRLVVWVAIMAAICATTVACGHLSVSGADGVYTAVWVRSWSF